MGVIHDLRVQGGAQPAMMWKLFMDEATKNLPPDDFVKPKDDMISLQVTVDPETGEVMVPNRFTPQDQISIAKYRYGSEPKTQAPILPEMIPIVPNVTLIPQDQANNILIQAGYTHIVYKKEVYSGVPSGYTHRQDPMWDVPMETNRQITVWVNP
jgi:hypothetical protein